ncbi:MAG: hypothetical protein GY842_16750 [bacterium]|nr:hypothetical protein [bacterium]
MSSWDELEKVVASKVLEDARRVSKALTELGVPHALVGGLAVGLHGYPRATKDVDFLVGPEAFACTTPLLTFREELADVVQWGVIDLIAALPEDPVLADEVTQGGIDFVPVVGIEVLMVMKLRAGRTQDLADIEALVRGGADIAAVLEFLQTNEPRHIPVFSRCAQRALES